MKSALVGVIGHVDHGKTALVRALTGTETDRLAEEKARGLSIVLGFAVLRGEGAEVDLIDMPGHERFVRAMISGATGIDAVLLAVDAGEGIKPQTVEHLHIAALLGVRRGVVALTKCDAADRARVAAVAGEAAALCRGAGLAVSQVIETSAISGQGIDDLAMALRALAVEPPDPAADAPVYLPVDRSFTVKGFGTVVTGTLRGGVLPVGGEVEIVPGALRAEVRGLQIHGRAVERALPGRRVAVNLRGVRVEDVPRGHALATPGRLQPGRWLDVALRVAPGEEALPSGVALDVLIGTHEVQGRLRLLEAESAAPGTVTIAQLRLARDVAVPAGEPFVLRVPSPPRTVAGGVVLDPVSRRRKRFDAKVVGPLRHLSEGDCRAAFEARLDEAGRRGLPVGDLARILRQGADGARDALRDWRLPVAGDRALHPAHWSAVAEAVTKAVLAFCRAHPLEDGLPRAALGPALPDVPEPVIAAAVERLVGQGVLARKGGALRPDVEQAAKARDQRLLQDVERAFAAAGLQPPDEAEIVGRDPRRQEALRYLLRQGTLVRTTDRVQKRTITFHRDAIDEARRTLRQRFGADGFLAKEAGAALGISRKYSIPLLEHLDQQRFTRRADDRRTVVAAPEEEAASARGAGAAGD